MNRNSIRWRLPASYGVIALLAALSLGSVMMLVLRSYYIEQERDYLYGNAVTLRPILEQILQSDLPEGFIQDQINGLAFLSQARIRLLDMKGNIIADSGVPESHQVVAVSGGAQFNGDVMFSVPVNPPEGDGPILIHRSDENLPPAPILPFDEKFPPGEGADIIVSVRASPYGYGFVAKTMADPSYRSAQIVGVLLTDDDGKKLGTLEFSNGPSYGADVMRSVGLAWLIASVFAIAIAALAGWFASRQVTQPVLALTNATRRMESGELSFRVVLRDQAQDEFVVLARSFNNMARRVEEIVSTLRAFVADAAHELHTPLTALHTNLELAADEKDPAQKAAFLARAQEQSRRLEELVNGLLNLSLIEAAHAGPQFVPVDLNRLLAESAERFASRAEQAGRSFLLKLPGETISLNGNQEQIQRAFDNLLENAFKFTSEGSSIAMTLEEQDQNAVIIVTDSGKGIHAEDLPHLFERFHRGRNAAGFSGNGLGLAIVKAIVEAHKGRVEARSDGFDKGSTFSIILPLLNGFPTV